MSTVGFCVIFSFLLLLLLQSYRKVGFAHWLSYSSFRVGIRSGGKTMKRNDVLKYKKPTNNLKHLLGDNVLDDETRRQLMIDIQDCRPHALPHAHPAPPLPSQSNPPVSNPRGSMPNPGGAARVPSPSTGSDELLSVMIQRLRTVEGQVTVLQKELKEKSLKLVEYEDKLRHEKLERRKSEDSRLALVKEVSEMHQFLADYGLKWVGDHASSSQQSSRQPSPASGFNLYGGEFKDPPILDGESSASAEPPPNDTKSAASRSVQPLPFDLERLKKNAEILTAHVGFSGIQGEGAKRAIKEREMVFICVYLDGICVNSGPFRPYGWPLCEAILQDILEGYYPYEFRERYPDGCPITIVDSSDTKCPLVTGKTTGGNQIHTVDSTNSHGYKPLTKDALLKKLPEQYVTSGGQLVNIRSGIEMFIGGTAAAKVGGPTSPLRTIAPSTSASAQLRDDPNSGDVTSVQVKLPSGQKVMLHMFFSNTIQDVRSELEKAVPAMSSNDAGTYELCTVFPRRSYEDYSQTLQELGLVPNCTLMIKRIVPSSQASAAPSS